MNKRLTVPNKNKLRNLVQYRDLTDEEFNEVYNDLYGEDISDQLSMDDLDERIEEKTNELSQEYDLTDMKANDKAQLRSLLKAMVQLDIVENKMYTTGEDVSMNSIAFYEKLGKIASTLRSDISKLSEDLHLTRKIRKQDTEQSVLSAIEVLKTKAKKFARHSMLHVFCPKCKTLLSTIWLLYSEEDNIVKLKCGKCGKVLEVELAPLYDSKNKNLENITLP